MLQKTDITVGIGLTQDVQIPGRFFYYLTGSAGGGDQSILIKCGTSGQTTKLMPGQAFRIADEDKTVTDWYVSNFAGAGTITGTVLVGDGDFTDNRISGSVEIVDGGKNRTNAGQAFLAFISSSGVAAQYTHLALYNPSTTKNLVVNSMLLSSTVTTGFWLASYNAVLASANPYMANPQSKRMGGAASVGTCWIENNAAQRVTQKFALLSLTANVTQLFTPKEPIVIPPGQALVIVSNAASVIDVNAVLDLYEDAI
ncbi:MAG: hypothetical protein ACXWJD_04040 [Burkholderiaceae bacterium]